MHLLVLSAFRPEMKTDVSVGKFRSQCTFWCSVLSDSMSGAWISPAVSVSMHLLVLSAFRLAGLSHLANTLALSQCTFWCSVLSDGARRGPTAHRNGVSMHLLVLSAFRQARQKPRIPSPITVSMHLLVLSAFRRENADEALRMRLLCLNAPSGAQCLPTRLRSSLGRCSFASLNAPSGAQCLPTPPPENRATTPFTGTKSPPTWKAPHRIGSHLSN